MYEDLSLQEIISFEDDTIYQYISDNKNLTLEFIQSHIYEDWDFETLTYNNIITPEFIIKNKDRPWNFNYYSFLKNLTMTQFLQIEDKIEDYETLSRNHNISLEYIFEHSDNPWCWLEISKRDDINDEFYDEHKPLNFYLIYKKSFFSADFISTYKERIIIDFEDYIENLSVYEKIEEQKKFIDLLFRHI